MLIVGHINFMNEFSIYWLIWTYDRIKYPAIERSALI
jgi:hypothetical protein